MKLTDDLRQIKVKWDYFDDIVLCLHTLGDYTEEEKTELLKVPVRDYLHLCKEETVEQFYHILSQGIKEEDLMVWFD